MAQNEDRLPSLRVLANTFHIVKPRELKLWSKRVSLEIGVLKKISARFISGMLIMTEYFLK